MKKVEPAKHSMFLKFRDRFFAEEAQALEKWRDRNSTPIFAAALYAIEVYHLHLHPSKLVDDDDWRFNATNAMNNRKELSRLYASGDLSQEHHANLSQAFELFERAAEARAKYLDWLHSDSQEEEYTVHKGGRDSNLLYELELEKEAYSCRQRTKISCTIGFLLADPGWVSSATTLFKKSSEFYGFLSTCGVPGSLHDTIIEHLGELEKLIKMGTEAEKRADDRAFKLNKRYNIAAQPRPLPPKSRVFVEEKKKKGLARTLFDAIFSTTTNRVENKGSPDESDVRFYIDGHELDLDPTELLDDSEWVQAATAVVQSSRGIYDLLIKTCGVPPEAGEKLASSGPELEKVVFEIQEAIRKIDDRAMEIDEELCKKSRSEINSALAKVKKVDWLIGQRDFREGNEADLSAFIQETASATFVKPSDLSRDNEFVHLAKDYLATTKYMGTLTKKSERKIALLRQKNLYLLLVKRALHKHHFLLGLF
jgi:hypothetical protein